MRIERECECKFERVRSCYLLVMHAIVIIVPVITLKVVPPVARVPNVWAH